MDEHEDQDDGSTARRAHPVRHRPWSTLLLVAHICATVVGAVALGFGVLAFAIRATSQPAGPDDWGGAIGMVLTTVGLVVAVPGAVLTALTVAGRREAEQGRPDKLRNVAAAAIVIAGCCALLAATGGFTSAFAVDLAFCGVYALPAVLLLHTTSARSDPRPGERDHTGVTTP